MNQHIPVILIFVLALCTNTKINATELLEYNKLMSTYSDNKKYNEVCWLTSHNCYAYYDPLILNPYIARNQRLNITGQLQYGVRGFMVDLYYKNDDPKNTIILAHRFSPEPAIWNRRYFKQDFSRPFLKSIKEWLDNNLQDIITIHLESYIGNYEKIKQEINDAGLDIYLFDLCEYNSGISKKGRGLCINNGWLGWTAKINLDPKELVWPTIGEMRQQNKRLVIFSDKIEDVGYGIMHTSHIMETEFNLSEHPACEKRFDNRSTKAAIFVMNHFYKYMAVPAANMILNYDEANKYSTLLLRSGACCLQENKCPNFIAIDDVGYYNNDRQIVLDINTHNELCYCSNKADNAHLEDHGL